MKNVLYTAPTIEPMISETREDKRPRQSGVYQIVCKPTGKVYIGSAVWLAKRKRYHREDLLKGKHHSQHLQKAWNKYGADAFGYSVLEYCEKEKIIEREQFYIDLLKSSDREHGFNIQPKAYSNLGMKFGPEMKAKISAARKKTGCTLSIEQIEELRERMKGNSFSVGLKHSELSKEKMKAARKGRAPSLGMRHTDETRQKMSEKRKGRPLSLKNRIGISIALSGKKKSAEHIWNAHVAQAKIKPDQFEKIKAEYIPGVVKMKDLAVLYGCCTQTICNVINGKRMANL